MYETGKLFNRRSLALQRKVVSAGTAREQANTLLPPARCGGSARRTQDRAGPDSGSPQMRATVCRTKSYAPEEFRTLRCSVTMWCASLPASARPHSATAGERVPSITKLRSAGPGSPNLRGRLISTGPCRGDLVVTTSRHVTHEDLNGSERHRRPGAPASLPSLDNNSASSETAVTAMIASGTVR